MTTNKKENPFSSQSDDSEWGAPIKVTRSKKPKSVMVSVRFSAEEFKLIQEASDSASQSISAFIRENVLSGLTQLSPRGSKSIRTSSLFRGDTFITSTNTVISTQVLSQSPVIGFQSGKLVSK